MDKTDFLLTDEFVEFSQRIAALHAEKKKKKQELKEFYEKIQAEMKELDAQAKKLSDDFDRWRRGHQANMAVAPTTEVKENG